MYLNVKSPCCTDETNITLYTTMFQLKTKKPEIL